LPLHNLRTLDEYLYASNLVFEMFIPGFTVIGAITAILAASGLFGLISRSVVQRTHEIGIRRALGATRWQATATFLRQGGFYLVVGIIGLGLGTFFTSMVAASVPNVLAHVLPVTVAVLFLVALVIFVASYLPTRRAVALEPGDALRHE
jgi:ABC-type antimicrobial peptide transport system permease subunit